MVVTDAPRLEYRPQQKQESWHECPAYESGFGGAKGGGKSLAMLMEATRYTAHPRFRGIIFRREYPRLQELIDRAHDWYPGLGATWRGDERTWTFAGGAKLYFRHCQTEEDKRDYHGHEYHFMGFDQLEEFTESQYTFLMAQARTSVSELPPYIRVTFNPGGVGHSWVKARFIDFFPDFRERACGPVMARNEVGDPTGTRCFHFALLADNPALERADPTYRMRLAGLSEDQRRGLLDGDWDTFEGQFFTEWRRETHTCEPFEIPSTWTLRGIGVDYGYGAPWSCHFYARDEPTFKMHGRERWYAYREFYGPGLHDYEQAARIKEAKLADIAVAERAGQKLRWTQIGDPSMWNKKPESQSSVADEYAKHGVHLTPGNNDRRQGWAKVRRFLATHRELPGGGREPLFPDERPGLLFLRQRCPEAIRTLPTLLYDAHDKEDTHEGPEVADHAADELRYFLMSRGDGWLQDVVNVPIPFHVGLPRPEPKWRKPNVGSLG